MNEKTRRTLCRIGFIVLAVLPTFAAIGTAVYRALPRFAAHQRQEWQRAIEDRTGLRATLQHVSYPRGGVTLLAGLTLTDPDSLETVLAARLVELAQTRKTLAIVISQPEVQRGQFSRLCEVLHERLVRGRGVELPTRVLVHQATLNEGSRAMTLGELHCLAEPAGDETRINIEFDVAGTEMSSPAQLRLVRCRTPSPPVTRWELRTGPSPLPCSLFSRYCRPLEGLGGDCRFRGAVAAEQSPRGWNGEVAGEFLQVDLNQLVKPFPHKLSGVGRVSLNRVAFREDRICDAAGRIESDGGVVSQSLIAQFAEAFVLDVSPRAYSEETPLLTYDHLAVGFQIDANGMKLTGFCSQETPGVILSDRQGPLVVESQTAAVPAAALAQALSPDVSLRVPATAETNLLMQAIPLPPRTGRPERTARQPGYSPLRLRGG